MMLRALWAATVIWLAALVLAGLAALVAFAVTPARAQSRDDNLVSSSGSATGTSATQITAAPATTRRLYIRSVECGRTDAGKAAIYITFNDDGSTTMVLPNAGGGGGSNMTFPSPLTVPGIRFQALPNGVTTLFCSAQGFSGN